MYNNRNEETPTHCSSPEKVSEDEGCSPRDESETPKYSSEVTCFTKENIDSLVRVSEVPGKGRCLFVRKAFDPGELIFAESPLFMIDPTSNQELWDELNKLNEESPFVLPPLWHKAALFSILEGNEESNSILENKWVENRNQEVSADVLRVLNSICTIEDGEFYYDGVVIKPEVYQLYLQVWPLNAFGRTSEPDGLVIYDKISYVAHSCNPSCCWHHTENDEFVLRARKKLVPGDEITISYLGETDLLSPTFRRRTLLQNWHFFCTCERCSIPIDNCRGFLCKCCHYGTIFLNYDSFFSSHSSMQCELCGYQFTESEMNEYIELERAYVYRIDGIDKSNLMDILQVYDHAKNVFKQHWALYQLQTLLYDIYKEKSNFEQAKIYLMQRIHYVDKVILGPLYCVAFMHEEMADILTYICDLDQNLSKIGNPNSDIGALNMIMGYYFNSAALLSILCGYKHSYYHSVISKRYRIEELAISLIKLPQEVESPDEA
ncbi:uncharacterized protein TA06820 [Theileria annulata]|uniref:SET domain-containing protein n=1 Tax=Theileria annulata TaxID=5874 RepID=Q4UHT5_THEAN|nr:uncharacterized protein TA06820 [Theileria annulata]CAI73354.1 hypothetical protein, conserved [Theileria annulata]|eukprot:XP_954031.1 hypothetical protein, conserved [Theileria annulata]